MYGYSIASITHVSDAVYTSSDGVKRTDSLLTGVGVGVVADLPPRGIVSPVGNLSHDGEEVDTLTSTICARSSADAWAATSGISATKGVQLEFNKHKAPDLLRWSELEGVNGSKTKKPCLDGGRRVLWSPHYLNDFLLMENIDCFFLRGREN